MNDSDDNKIYYGLIIRLIIIAILLYCIKKLKV